MIVEANAHEARSRAFNSSGKESRILFVILLCAVVLRVTSVIYFHPPLLSDDIEYNTLARSLVSGNGFSIDGVPSSYRTPGYPGIVAICYAAFGVDPLPVRALQVVCDVVSCILLYAIARKLFNGKIGLWTAAVFAFFPQQILYVSHLMSETIFTTLLLGMVWLVILMDSSFQWKKSLLLGILLGIATLVRPVVLLIPVVWIFYWRGRAMAWPAVVRAAGTAAIVSALIITPWMWRNAMLFSHFSLASNSGVNLWIGHHEGAGGSYSYPSNAENPLFNVADDFARSELGTRLALSFVREHPMEEIVLTGKKIAHFFEADYWLLETLHFAPGRREQENPVLPYSELSLRSVVGIQAPFMSVVLLAIVAVAFSNRRDASAIRIAGGTILYWLIMHVVYFASARYRFPVTGLLMLLAVYGVVMLRKKAAQQSRMRRLVFAALLIVLVGGWCAEGYTLWKKRNAVALLQVEPVQERSLRLWRTGTASSDGGSVNAIRVRYLES